MDYQEIIIDNGFEEIHPKLIVYEDINLNFKFF